MLYKSRTPEKQPLPGSRLSLEHTYVVGDAIEHGPLATMYNGQWNPFEVPVVIRACDKLADVEPTERTRRRICNTILARAGFVRGPGLPDIVDIGLDDENLPFSVMRLPAGQSLRARLEARGPLTASQTATVVTDIARALTTCREAGAFHRGPTVDRIWLTDDGHAILLGLGEVLYHHDVRSSTGPRRIELLWHLPPECFAAAGYGEGTNDPTTERIRLKSGSRGGREIEESAAAEVFALGSLAYHCLMGHHPYFVNPAEPSSGILAAVTGEALPLTTLDPEHPLFEAIAIAMRGNPEDRFETVAAFVENIAVDEEDGSADADHDDDEWVPLRERLRVQAPEGEAAATEAPREVVKVRTGILWKITTVALFCALLLYAFVDRARPASLLITSDPPGLELAEVVGHQTESRGTTPLVLTRRKLNAPIDLRTVGPDGELGQTRRFFPRDFQDLGRCRRMTVELEFPNL